MRWTANYIVALKLKGAICHPNEWQLGPFSPEATSIDTDDNKLMNSNKINI